MLNYHRNKLDETLRSDLLYLYQNNEDAPFLYAYDNNRNITHIQQDTAHIYYQYDALNQLTREDNSVLNKSIVYSYDDRGNLLTKQEYAYVANGGTLGVPTATITYGYEAENQTWADQLTSYNGEAIRYDASGNPTTYRGYTMTWQGRRLTGATNGTTTTAYTYDENGLRTQKTVNGTATQYRYHGSVLISQVSGNDKLLFSYDANGNVVAVNYNGTYYYYVRNGQNDVIRLIDGSNNTVVEYSYDSWGRQISCTGTLATTLGAQNPFRYRGYVYDTDTGLYYLQTRYYDPEVGRFINADIYVSTGQGLLGHNMYAYCLNSPTNMADSEGSFGIGLGLLIGGLISTAVSAVVGGIDSVAKGGSFAEGAAAGAIVGASIAIGSAIAVVAGVAVAASAAVVTVASAVVGGISAVIATPLSYQVEVQINNYKHDVKKENIVRKEITTEGMYERMGRNFVFGTLSGAAASTYGLPLIEGAVHSYLSSLTIESVGFLCDLLK